MRASVQNNPISRVRGPETTETSDRRDNLPLELQTKVRGDFKITEKAPIRAFSWLKALELSLSVLPFHHSP